MLIAGVNLGLSSNGHVLKDGGACILENGNLIIAIAEERLSREKHASGFNEALSYCLKAIGADYSDLDMVVASSCCDIPWKDGSDIGIPVDRDKIFIIPSHHLSHAYSAFFTSSFESAAIMIIDNEGNITKGDNDQSYWDNIIERNSYYCGDKDEIKQLDNLDDRLSSGETGIGESYRHFTYFLGWNSYVYAGKTMGLAPYGDPNELDNLTVFKLTSGQVHSYLENGRENPSNAVKKLGIRNNIDLGNPRAPNEDISEHHCNIAAKIQQEIEDALIYKANELHKKTNLDNLCFGGGLALNCVANRKILENTPFKRMHIYCAPGDSGQCVGNALYGWTKIKEKRRPLVIYNPYLGRDYFDTEIVSTLEKFSCKIKYTRSCSVCKESAKLIAKGNVVGWFQGKSELGPRALGARSILADPRNSMMRDYLNIIIKKREKFRPFAPSILENKADKIVTLQQKSPYMEMTGIIKHKMRDKIPAVTHVDGSSRIHTVTKNNNAIYTQLIEEYERITGLPVILNTSFNLNEEPIVESPDDALRCYLSSDIDVLVIGNYVVRRNNKVSGTGFNQWINNI